MLVERNTATMVGSSKSVNNHVPLNVTASTYKKKPIFNNKKKQLKSKCLTNVSLDKLTSEEFHIKSRCNQYTTYFLFDISGL